MSMPVRKNVAIVGATSHIAKGLIYNYARTRTHDLVLFARSVERVKAFMASIAHETIYPVRLLDDFFKGDYDVIINCIGIGQPARLKSAAAAIFRLTETYDNMVLDYLEKHPDAMYINFSSGAVYGKDFTVPASDETPAIINVNHLGPEDFYMIAKTNSEAKHRAYSSFNIVDLRVFAYFSRFIDLDSHYFVTELISCIKSGREFITTQDDMTRDFIHPEDLFSLVGKCIEKEKLNDVFDVYSRKPVTKFEILEFFKKEYKLQYVIKEDVKIITATGSKTNYYSNNRSAEQINFQPIHTALESIVQESKILLEKDRT